MKTSKVVDVTRYRGMTEKQITAAVNDRVTRAWLLADDDQRVLALDFTARLVTGLRVSGIWPARYEGLPV